MNATNNSTTLNTTAAVLARLNARAAARLAQAVKACKANAARAEHRANVDRWGPGVAARMAANAKR